MTLYACRGCGSDVADDESDGFGGALTTHDSAQPVRAVPARRPLLRAVDQSTGPTTERRPAMTDIMTRLGKQPGDEIDYDDAETLRAILVGRKIVSITRTTGEALHRAEKGDDGYYFGGRGEYDDVIEYHFSDGLTLRAHAHDGGCGCSNGCFSVALPEDAGEKLIGSTIMNVSVEERTTEWSYPEGDIEKVIVDGKGETPSDGSSTIRVFAYLPGLDEPAVLVESEGGDNGYYGWGFHFSIAHPVLVVQEAPQDQRQEKP